MNPDDVIQVDSQADALYRSLSSDTQQLMSMLKNEHKAQNLADMLHGAWATLKTGSDSPDFLPQVAHSIREFIEKLHDRIVEVPVKRDGNGLNDAVITLSGKWSVATQKTQSIDTSDWSGAVDNHFQKVLKALSDFFTTFTKGYRPRKGQYSAVIRTLDGSGQTMPVKIVKERLSKWSDLDDYFKDVAHHQLPTTKKELMTKITILEDLILSWKYPERGVPINTLDLLDSFIAEGEAR